MLRQLDYSIVQTHTLQMKGHHRIIKQAFPGPVGCPRDGRGLKTMNKMHQISYLCLLASSLLWFGKQNHLSSLLLQVADLHTSQLGASVSQKQAI